MLLLIPYLEKLLNEIFEYNVLRINLAIFGKVFLSIIHYLEYPINR